MKATILRGCVFDKLPEIPAGSIDCAVTSPPYWMLRSYLAKDHPLKRFELGSEATPGQYVENMVRVFSLVRNALAAHGTVFLNVGDTYTHSRGKRKPGDKHGPKQCSNAGSVAMPSATMDGHAEGNLALIPWRLALALQDDGWIVRSVIVWHKPAPMPASLSGWAWRRCRIKLKSQEKAKQPSRAGVPGTTQGNSRDFIGGVGWIGGPEWQDCPGCKRCSPNGGYVLRKGSWRPTSSWEPVLMLAKSASYYSDGEAVKQPPAASTVSRDQYTRIIDDPDEQFAVAHDHETICDGANLRDVWTISSEALREKHYAAYPTELVTRCLKAGTSAKGYCPTCGAPWCRMLESETTFASGSGRSGNPIAGKNGDKLQGGGGTGDIRKGPVTETRTLGWRPSCGCHAGLAGDDFEMIGTPTGTRIAEDPSRQVGRAGFDRPRGENEGIDGMTRYEQREYAKQIKASDHRDEMKAEAGERFAHYIRTDKSGARPVPRGLLDQWIERGWVAAVAIPAQGEPLPPRPGRVLDPFAGSGRTAISAMRLGLDFTGVELNPTYADMAERLIRGDAPLFNQTA